MTTSEATSASSTASSGAGILAIGPVIALVAISLASHFGMAFGTDKLVFSKPAYVDAKRKVESLEAQIEKLKLEIARANEAKQKALKATLKSAEETLASAKQIQQGLSMRAMLIQGVTQMVLFISLSSIFDGAPLVKLPFEPFSFLTGITHKGLPGNDMTQGSWLVVFILLNMSLKPCLDAIWPPKNAPASGGGGFGEMFSKAQELTDRMVGEDKASSNSSKKSN